MKKNITEFVRWYRHRTGMFFILAVVGGLVFSPLTGRADTEVTEPTAGMTESIVPETAVTENPLEESSETESGIETEIMFETSEPEARDLLTGNVANAATAVNVRTGAGTGYSVVTKVYVGQLVHILEETTVQNQKVWYRIRFTKEGADFEGWICGDYVNVNRPVPPAEPENPQGTDAPEQTDEAFIQSLKDAGFPDSYCSGLLALHKKYPRWQFVPVQTGLDWNYVIENESVIGRNLVPKSVNDARKATDTRAYDWSTNQWYGFDGADWVSASPSYIAYCMDPRNFFDENYIFQFETLEYETYQNKDGVSNILKNSFMAGDYKDTDGMTRNYAESFVTIGTELAVSPYHLASRCLQEQGTKGTSQLISGTYSEYKGYYNHFNVGAYTTASASATLNGLAYAKRVGWNSIYKSLQGGSAVVADRYVKKGQNTVYFEKFNVVNQSNLFTHQYMTNVMAAFNEGSKISKAYADKSAAFVFRIPVYNNMPETPAPLVDNGNPNNWLKTMDVSGYTLTPSFQPATTEYSLIVPDEVQNISVSGTAVFEAAAVSGTGNHTLSYGENVIAVTCIAQNGTARTYTIRVVRQQNQPEPPATENPVTPPEDPNSILLGEGISISTGYKVNERITGIAVGSLAEEVLKNIAATNCSVKIQKADGSEQTGTVGTGNTVAVYDTAGSLIKAFPVLIYGDINGDGKVTNLDLVMITRQILGIGSLSDIYLEAADAGCDGKLSNRDLVLVQKHILGLLPLAQ